MQNGKTVPWKFDTGGGLDVNGIGNRASRLARTSKSAPTSFLARRLVNIEDDTVWVSKVAARDFRILLYHGATGCYELSLGGLNVWHQKIKDRPMFFAAFDV